MEWNTRGGGHSRNENISLSALCAFGFEAVIRNGSTSRHNLGSSARGEDDGKDGEGE